jgi:hypothetical protein
LRINTGNPQYLSETVVGYSHAHKQTHCNRQYRQSFSRPFHCLVPLSSFHDLGFMWGPALPSALASHKVFSRLIFAIRGKEKKVTRKKDHHLTVAKQRILGGISGLPRIRSGQRLKPIHKQEEAPHMISQLVTVPPFANQMIHD